MWKEGGGDIYQLGLADILSKINKHKVQYETK